MKFLYEYRTPDNAKHNGVICASDKEAAYAALKKQGIKPSRFAEAPGFFNKLFGKGKRWMAIGVLTVIAAIAIGRARTPAAPQSSSLDATFDSVTRRHPIGDPAVIERGIATGWADVFELEGDRFLASFAVPGTEPAVRSTTEEKLEEALRAAPAPSSCTSKSGSLEARQIRAMVEGMKQELREFLSEGGSFAAYGRRLVDRQEREIGYFKIAQSDFDAAVKKGLPKEELEAMWEAANDKLRVMGIRSISYFGH